MGLRDKTGTTPFKRLMRFARDFVKDRGAVIGEYRHRYKHLFACKDIFDVCPRAVEIRRASTPELHSALPRVK